MLRATALTRCNRTYTPTDTGTDRTTKKIHHDEKLNFWNHNISKLVPVRVAKKTEYDNAGRRIKFAREKVSISELFSKSSERKTSNLVKWTQLISVDFSFQILAFYLSLGGFSFHVSFLKRTVEMFVRNLSWLKIAVGDLWIHSTTPGMNIVKRNTERRIPRSSENRRLFPGANLILRPA